MQRFKSQEQARPFLSTHAMIGLRQSGHPVGRAVLIQVNVRRRSSAYCVYSRAEMTRVTDVVVGGLSLWAKHLSGGSPHLV